MPRSHSLLLAPPAHRSSWRAGPAPSFLVGNKDVQTKGLHVVQRQHAQRYGPVAKVQLFGGSTCSTCACWLMQSRLPHYAQCTSPDTASPGGG